MMKLRKKQILAVFSLSTALSLLSSYPPVSIAEQGGGSLRKLSSQTPQPKTKEALTRFEANESEADLPLHDYQNLKKEKHLKKAEKEGWFKPKSERTDTSG